jgi:hypothetical protein
MSILLQEEKAVLPEDIEKYYKEREACEKCEQHPLWRFIRWLTRQP